MTPERKHGGTAPRRKFRSRTFPLASGEQLALRPDGTIELRDTAGTTTGTYVEGDPEWAGYAIRFGLKGTPATPRPDGRDTRKGSPPAG